MNIKFKKWNNNYWMISDSLVDYTNDYKVKNSKIESMRPIYDGPNANCNFDETIKNNPKKLVLCAIFKSIVGASDWAARNFLVKGKKIYSIDDHSTMNQDVKLLPSKIKKETKKLWELYIKNNRNTIIKKINKWNKRITKSNLNSKDILIKRLKNIIKLI